MGSSSNGRLRLSRVFTCSSSGMYTSANFCAMTGMPVNTRGRVHMSAGHPGTQLGMCIAAAFARGDGGPLYRSCDKPLTRGLQSVHFCACHSHRPAARAETAAHLVEAVVSRVGLPEVLVPRDGFQDETALCRTSVRGKRSEARSATRSGIAGTSRHKTHSKCSLTLRSA